MRGVVAGPLCGPCRGLRVWGPLLRSRLRRPDSYSRIVAIIQGNFVLLGSGAWWRPLSFPDGILLHLPRLGLQP